MEISGKGKLNRFCGWTGGIWGQGEDGSGVSAGRGNKGRECSERCLNWGKFGGLGGNLIQWKLPEVYEGDPSEHSNRGIEV